MELQTRPPRSEALLKLKELHLAREALVKDRTAAKNRRSALTAALLKRQNTLRLEQIERQMTAIEAAILEQIHADPDLSRRFAILKSIPGVSALTACALLIEMPKLGPSSRNRPQVSQAWPRSPGSPADGLDTPSFGEDAPQSAGPFICRPVAARINPDMKATYRRLRAAGKPAKLALTAVMRKLIVLANALLKANRTWTSKTA